MKKKLQRTLVYLLTLALLLPMISTIALPVMAAITAGTLNNMDKDLLLVAKDDVMGRKMQDLGLPTRKRASKMEE